VQIDAAIVRIMKTRKVLSHTLLITELFQQVNTLFLSYRNLLGIFNLLNHNACHGSGISGSLFVKEMFLQL